MKKNCFIILFVLCVSFAKAQQIGMFSHYFYKPMVYNPAFTGYDDATNAMLISRAQWTGFKGSPQLNLFTLDGTLINKKVGLGLSLISDRKGLTNRIGGNVGYSYRLNINDDTYLRFGVSLGVIDQTIDYSQAIVENSSDPTLFTSLQRKTIIDGSGGLAFIWKQLEFGAAVPQLFGNKINYVDNTGVRAYYTQARHILGTLKYKFFISKEKGISIAPMALVRFVQNTPFQYDGNIILDWKNKFWIGATYKSDYAVGLNAGICIHKQLYVGYAYDYIIGDIGNYSGMSHEIMINFKFGQNKKEELPEVTPVAEPQALLNPEYDKRIDSLNSALASEKERINENQRKLKELSDKIEAQSKLQQTPVTQNQNNSEKDIAPVNPNENQNQNQNQNSKAIEGDKNKVLDNGVWFVTNNSADFIDSNDRKPQKGFYVVAGTFVYRDFAQAEVKRLKIKGFKNANWLFSKSKEYNYVFLSKQDTKENAFKKAEEARSAGIKDAWVLQLTE